MSQKSAKRLRRLIRASGAAAKEMTGGNDNAADSLPPAAEASLDKIATRSLKKMYAKLPHCDRAMINKSMDVMAKANKNPVDGD